MVGRNEFHYTSKERWKEVIHQLEENSIVIRISNFVQLLEKRNFQRLFAIGKNRQWTDEAVEG